jgi:uncharacterized protein YdgA (DUF945 family)
MKRWVVVLLVVLAAIVLVSPGIVGRLAERNLESNLEWAAGETGEVTVTGGSFDRGWFTSEGTRRIEIRHPQLRTLVAELSGVPAAGAPPVLIVSTRLDHGLIPVTSLSRESGSLAPALASAVSTLELDPGNGETIAIPGEIVTRVALTGSSTSHYRLDAGAFKDATTHVEWQGADVTVRLDAAGSSLGFDAVIEPVVIESAAEASGDRLSFGRITAEGEQQATRYGFNVGKVQAQVASAQGKAAVFGPLDVEAVTELDGERVNGRTTMSIREIAVPGVGNLAFDMKVAVGGLDGAALQGVLVAVEQAQSSATTDAALAGIYPAIESDIRRLLTRGLEIRVEQLDVLLPQGPLTSQLQVELPETDPASFTWAGVLLALQATADLSVPAAAMDTLIAVNPQANALVAMGILEKEGEFYRLHAEYAKGLLSVNGAPMPIPLPAAAR